MSLRLLHRRPEPVEDSYAAALRLAAEQIHLRRICGQTENDPADARTSNRAYDRRMEATR